jgi:hypothetical protein
VEGRDWNWVTQAKFVELRTSVASRCAVYLVDDQQDRDLLAAENVSNFVVEGRHAARSINQEYDDLGGQDRLLGLGPDLRQISFIKRINDRGVEAARVDQIKYHSIPLGLGHNSITCGAGPLVYDRQALAGQAIE